MKINKQRINKQIDEIDEEIKRIVSKIGYIPNDCNDPNIPYEACLGCGLCKGTNPIQEKGN